MELIQLKIKYFFPLIIQIRLKLGSYNRGRVDTAASQLYLL